MYNFIASKLDGNVIDIVGASSKDGAPLDAWPQKQSGTDNQLWEFIADPAGSGYFFIRSKLNGNVLDIEGASTQDGAPLDAWPQKQSGTDNQLWEFIADPAGSGYCFISSRLNGNVLDVSGNSTAAGARLDAYPRKFRHYDNQLWKVVNGSFPAVIDTVPGQAQGNSGYFNYVQANGSGCADLTGVKITLHVIEDLVWQSSTPSSVPGFGFQLNVNPTVGQPLDWLQFIVHIGNDKGLFPWINAWDPRGDAPIALWIQTVADPVAVMPAAARIPAGYSIVIALQYNDDAQVTGATWTVIDGSGATVGEVSYPLSSSQGGGVPSSDLSTMAAFQVVIGGAMDGAYATFSSGEGSIVLEADQPMTVDWWPSCIPYTGGTAESSNVGYGALPAKPDVLLAQPFGVITGLELSPDGGAAVRRRLHVGQL